MYSSIKTKGFTLIEVLIAMIILSFGLLGLAALQASGLKQNLSAHQRSQATTLAYDFADRLRANSMQRVTYMTNAGGNGTQTAACLTTTGCTIIEMANHDIFAWKNQITSSLSSGTGALAQTAGAATVCASPVSVATDPECADDVFTTTITWDENRDGNNDASFSVSFTL
jgi:type IV pilus assembly protein PilV